MWAQLLPADVVVVEATEAMWSSPPTTREAHYVEKAVLKRRLEFQAGRAAARAALHVLGIDRFDLIPGVHREPLWPTGIVGSITHTDHRCAAAVARQKQVTSLGIDLETDKELTADLMAFVCSDEERQKLVGVRDNRPGLWTKVIFSAKEAFFKAYFPHTRTFLSFHDVAIALRPSDQEFDVELINRDLPLLFGSRHAIGRYGIHDGLIFTAFATMA